MKKATELNKKCNTIYKGYEIEQGVLNGLESVPTEGFFVRGTNLKAKNISRHKIFN